MNSERNDEKNKREYDLDRRMDYPKPSKSNFSTFPAPPRAL